MSGLLSGRSALGIESQYQGMAHDSLDFSLISAKLLLNYLVFHQYNQAVCPFGYIFDRFILIAFNHRVVGFNLIAIGSKQPNNVQRRAVPDIIGIWLIGNA
jgi:hypothetical protein